MQTHFYERQTYAFWDYLMYRMSYRRYYKSMAFHLQPNVKIHAKDQFDHLTYGSFRVCTETYNLHIQQNKTARSGDFCFCQVVKFTEKD